MKLTDDKVIERAKQLYEEETGHLWIAASVDKSELDKFIERARVELSDIEEEGHS